MRMFLLLGLLIGGAASAAAEGDAAFDRLVDAYYAEFSAASPISATPLGLHDHDGDLDDVSEQGILREAARLRGWQARFAKIDGKTLSRYKAHDLAMLRSAMESALVETDQVQGWRHHPDFYTGLASAALYSLIKRSFAPPEARLKMAIAREQKIPALLKAGKQNLRDVPKISLDIVLDEIPGIIDFFERDVPAAFPEALRAQLQPSTRAVTDALRDYQRFLTVSIAPQTKPGFALGEAIFRTKLKANEMIDTPLEALLQRGEAELKRLQTEFKAAAARIDPGKPFAEVQLAVQKDHERPDRLLASTQARLAGMRQFLVDKHIVTLPSKVMPKVQETPPFMRATTMASMDTPGPFEEHATEAYFNMTLPEASWPTDKVEDFMRGAFSRPLVDVIAIHEAFPGHYTQFLWLPKIAGKVRKFEGVSTNIEGWAHYCEQMLLDEGYGNGDLKLRLAQLQDALLRAARYVAGIRMHTRGLSEADAVAFFQKEGFQSKEVARLEVRRGAEDPTYLYYTWGKLEILKLREDYKKKLGAEYSLAKFHDAFLAQGTLPLPLVRQALLE